MFGVWVILLGGGVVLLVARCASCGCFLVFVSRFSDSLFVGFVVIYLDDFEFIGLCIIC